MSNPEHFVCTVCRTREGDRGAHLRQCGQCLSQLYCSRECRMADWPKHRLVCEDAMGGRRFSVASLISVSEEEDQVSPISRVQSWKSAHSHTHSRGSSGGDWRRASMSLGAHITFDKRMPAGMTAKVDPNTIYYIKTIKPHAHNIMICGPYYPISVVRSQMVRRLLKYSHTAYAT